MNRKIMYRGLSSILISFLFYTFAYLQGNAVNDSNYSAVLEMSSPKTHFSSCNGNVVDNSQQNGYSICVSNYPSSADYFENMQDNPLEGKFYSFDEERNAITILWQETFDGQALKYIKTIFCKGKENTEVTMESTIENWVKNKNHYQIIINKYYSKRKD